MSEQGNRLPIADPAARKKERLEQAKAARERRVARERALADQVAGWFQPDEVRRSDFRDQFTITVPLARAKDTLRRCRDELGYAMLTDVTAIDTLRLPGQHPERFIVSWSLVNLDQEARLFLQAYVNEDDPVAPTASDLWPAADWAEREVYDMFGLEFEGHPNLIRLLMPFDYAGHPLRKDYPLRGRGERDNFPVVRRTNEERVHP
ncbi:MAG: NADH-quinone oxidoreductase subunit C [Planctomycetes bacterium]|nr:NADH-quinone oxidoreductase subunit C [Planctomycetota bacterium]